MEGGLLFGTSSSSSGDSDEDLFGPSPSSADENDAREEAAGDDIEYSAFVIASSSSEEADDDRDEDFVAGSDSSAVFEELLEAIDAPHTSVRAPAGKEAVIRKKKKTKKTQARSPQTKSRQKRKIRKPSGVSDSDDSIIDTLSLHSDESSDSQSQPDYQRQDPMADRTPRIRRTNTYPDRVAMENCRVDIENKKPPLSRLVFASWGDLNRVLESYCSDYKLLFRARDSQTVQKHNSVKVEQIPLSMEYSYKVFRCTHGCHQKSRTKGQRSTLTRFTGCKARFTAAVKNLAAAGDPANWKIILRNWTWTHNHPTSDTIFSGYFGASAVSEDSRIAEEVCLLADAHAESHYIQNYLSGALERHVTPQQARNIVQSVLKSTSAEKQLMAMLDALDENDDHEVLVIKDQNDVTCGVVTQTAVQKLALKQWRETLCMDWTYGTNNLGFHLGSLLVTSSTGRGVPVLDFIALDETMETMEIVLEFFKSHNSSWIDIETVVIDKDFKEWIVLEKCLPQVVVLLCQFHTMANWKKVVKKAKYGLNGVQRDEVESSIKQMMYSTTIDAFNRARDGFEKFCKGECPDICTSPCLEIFKYFQDNWESCSDMWSNHGRGNYFTAGNTTTNRIESNWNQLKRLLGRKTRIDRTFAGIFQNQVNIINSLLTSLRKMATQSRPVDTIPAFLQSVSALLSNEMFAKISAQWDLFIVNQQEARCVFEPSQSGWTVSLPGSSWCVDSREWSCSCMFFKSRRLPCQHMMMVASNGQGHEALPTATVPARWSMKETRTMSCALENGLVPLQEVINMVNARPSVVRAPQSSSPHSSSSAGPAQRTGRRTVKYVRLKRKEQANMVVLSDAEKYARAQAVFEPLIASVSGLSTLAYYQEMTKWKTRIEKEMGDCGAEISAVANDESDTDSFFDHLDCADVMAEMEADQELAMEAESLTGMERTRSLSDVKDDDESLSDESVVPPTQPSTRSTARKYEDSAPATETTIKLEHPKEKVAKKRSIEVLKLPPPRSRTRKKKKQGWATPQPKFAVILTTSELTTTVPQVLRWASYQTDVEKVSNVLEQYPVILTDKFIQARPISCQVSSQFDEGDHAVEHAFVIPQQLCKKAEASIKEKRDELAKMKPKQTAPWGLMVSMGEKSC